MSLIYSGDMLTKVYFPRETVPLAQVGVALIDLAIGLGTLVLILLVQGVRPSYYAISVVPALAVTFVWTAAAGVFASVLRDVGHFVNLFLRAGFFATPVMSTLRSTPRTSSGWPSSTRSR